MSEYPETTPLLHGIGDRQREAVQLQREHIALYERRLDRVERINHRAEAIQAHAGKYLRLVQLIATPKLLLVLALLLWPWLSVALA